MKSLFIVLNLLLSLQLFASTDISIDELERWFESDSFEPPGQAAVINVNGGQLVFLSERPEKRIHHHHNSLVIHPQSLDDGWVQLQQCHANMDNVGATQILFREGRVRELEVLSIKNIEKAWVEGPSIQLVNVGKDAEICIKAWSRSFIINDDGTYTLYNGPYMRRFLDGYFPMHVSVDVSFAGTGLKFEGVTPNQQQGFEVIVKGEMVNIDALFEGRLRTKLLFSVETL